MVNLPSEQIPDIALYFGSGVTFSRHLPPNEQRTPRKSASHGLQKYQIARFDAAVRAGGVEGEWDRCRRCIGVFIHGNDDAAGIEAELPGCPIQNAPVGLVRNKPINIRRLEARLLQRIADDFADFAHGMPENLRPIHADMTHGAGGGRSAVHIELVPVTAIRAQTGGENAPVAHGTVLILRLDDHRAGAITKQHACIAVFPVENARKGLRANNQGTLKRASLQIVISCSSCENKA